MKFRDVTAALGKRVWITISLVIIGALVAAIASVVQTPVYKVQVIIATIPPESITTGKPDYQVAIGLQFLGGSIAEAIESIRTAEAVSEDLQKKNISLSPDELLGKVTAEHEANSTSIKLTVSDSSPTRVVEIANTWAETSARIYDGSDLLLAGSLETTNAAVQPGSPYQPKPLIYVGMGIFLGLIIGFSLSVGIEYFDPHFRSSEETQEMLGLPVIGAVPDTDVSSDVSNKAYSGIRTPLLFTEDKEESKSVAIAPVLQFHSRPYVATNLAISIARTGRRALLIDCDFKNKDVSGLLGVRSNSGLAEILEHDKPANIHIAKTDTEHLHILPAGKTSLAASDLLSLPKFEKVLRELELVFDRIILDCPPLSSSIDAAIVASSARLSMLVIDVKTCTRSMALQALESFSSLQIKPTGIILANVRVKKSESDY
ncbi:MAG: polysaccharide biosynthesis tyrosine autokinase [Actinobacteria bacterium]|nr:polysaccharide biosynthesis tyrosine autokinase [Actinomycetota bacterium]